jgi:hypothetical protein
VAKDSERMETVGWKLSMRPAELKIRELTETGAPMVPRLILKRVPLQISDLTAARLELKIGQDMRVGIFQVRYGEIRLQNPVADRGPTASRTTSDTILRATRDSQREAQSMAFLKDLGMLSLDSYLRRSYSCPGQENYLTLPVQNGTGPAAGGKWYEFQVLLPMLRQMGWEIEIDPGFGFGLVEPSDWWSDLTEVGNQDWFRFDSGVEIDGRRISLLGALREMAGRLDFAKELPALLESREDAMVPLAIPGEDVVLAFPARRLGQLMSCLLQLFEGGEGGGSLIHKLGAAQVALLLPEIAGETARILRALGERLANFEGIARVPVPRSLKATLRDYQRDGVSWMQFLREYGLAGVLADDMGLGKTVQTLTHLLIERSAKRLGRPCWIVAPSSVVSNWAAEAARFAPSLRVLVLQGPERKELFARIPKSDLVITSFALLPRDLEQIEAHEYHYVILDEAQYIKNPSSKMALAAFGLKSRHRLCLTGTPMENHLGELIPLPPAWLSRRSGFFPAELAQADRNG